MLKNYEQRYCEHSIPSIFSGKVKFMEKINKKKEKILYTVNACEKKV